MIEPRVRIIEIRGIDQKDNPQYDPGASTATGIDPGYERRVGIDRLGKANEVTYYLTNALNAKTVIGSGPAAGALGDGSLHPEPDFQDGSRSPSP